MTKLNVLVLCTGNSARSIMAEYWINHDLGDTWQAFSAGVDPKGLNPWTKIVLEEKGFDLSAARSESVYDYLDRDDLDLVVTVCDHARETCPVFPHPVEQIHVGFEDPAEYTDADEQKALEMFREVRDRIRSVLIPILLEKAQQHTQG
jgi:arsenate reductase